ncbi:hypothetical protein BN1058_02585 [Paraliobacillus sp. PM-2]|uniref:hypothetical protein n=1 Tax=Paraliobacillus sp. PM-2 TaxID=1462524 RepID=UPI00061BBF02|nr:hypothetical protein [Paraliobacillus sp. PM-2]CQR48231.1 hypothetical protein BN1058_02585 [Paraliobacillus sp. PM-2]
MSVTMIIATFVVGLIMLILGLVIKNKWLKILSLIPFAIFLFALIRLLGFLFH